MTNRTEHLEALHQGAVIGGRDDEAVDGRVRAGEAELGEGRVADAAVDVGVELDLGQGAGELQGGIRVASAGGGG